MVLFLTSETVLGPEPGPGPELDNYYSKNITALLIWWVMDVIMSKDVLLLRFLVIKTKQKLMQCKVKCQMFKYHIPKHGIPDNILFISGGECAS